MEKVWKKSRRFLIAPGIVILIMLLIYLIKGIYPFGNMTVANGDMSQSYMTFYHFLYDIFHNGKSVFYDYTLGMGSNMFGGFISDGLLNPNTFIILLGKRENIANMFSFVLMIKISLIALTSHILFDKLYKKNGFYNIIFSVLYALSGYVLMYNTNLMWLDVVALFPLFILSIKHMFEKDKIYWYAIILTLMLVFNYNLAYMVLMFIIFIIPIYIKLGLPKEERKKAVFNLIMGTVLSVGLSAFAFIPSFVQVMQSYRMSGNVTNTVENTNILFKIVVLIFYSLPLYGFINYIGKYKKDNKNVIIYILALVFSWLIPVIFERVNLLWHTGSYQEFPFRYGFIPTFIMYLASLKYFAEYEKEEKYESKYYKYLGILAIIIFALMLVMRTESSIILNMSMPAFKLPKEIFIKILISTMLMLITIFIVLNIEKEKIKKVLILIIVLTEVLAYTYAYIGVSSEYRFGAEWSDDGIHNSYNIQESFDINDPLYRMKDLTATTTENCSLVYNVPSMSTFLHIISKEQVLNCEQLGYSNNKTKINDFGGTIFSDAVYGIKYVLSKDELSEKIYNHVKTSENGTKLYEYKNTLPIGITYQNEVIDIPEDIKIFDAQNYLYKNLFNKQENIIETTNIDIANVGKEKMKYTINVEGNKELYIYAKEKAIGKISVNGKEIIIPTINNNGNVIYPNGYNKGILDLGNYENETVEIEFYVFNDLKEIQLGLLDVDKYNQIFEEKNNNIKVEVKGDKITINGNVEKDTNLLLPINYDKGWKVNKSSNDTEINRVYNTFIGIKLKQGENNIELKFRPFLWKECLIVTIVTITLMIIMYFVSKKFDIRNLKFLMIIFWILGIIIYLVCIYKIYIMSIIHTFIG